MKMRHLLLALTLLPVIASCKSLAKNDETELKVALRGAAIPDEERKDIPFNFCPLKKSFSLVNGLWLSYFSALQYSHYKVAGPELEALGFGEKGEGDAYRKAWYVVRLKKIIGKQPGTDDKWKDEAARLARLEDVRAEYRVLYGSDYEDNGVSAKDFEKELLSPDREASIVFLNGVSTSRYFNPTTQALYAENRERDFAIISIRGSEFDELADVSTDLNMLQRPFEKMGNVHSGFYAAYHELDGAIINLLKRKSESRPLTLWLTGHSLGGAITTLLTAKILTLQEKGELPNVHLQGYYTIGSPRVGNPDFAKNFDELTEKKSVTTVRIRNFADPVTSVPVGLYGKYGYWHVGSLAYIAGNGVLYQGDGWEEVEGKSDYMKRKTPSINDHLLGRYWKGMKRAYLEAEGSEKSDCRLLEGNQPPKPFHENFAERK